MRNTPSGVRKEYLLRLIRGVRKQIENDPETVAAKKELGDEVTIGKWADATFLCDIVEQEVIANENVPDISSEDFREQVVDPYYQELKEFLHCVHSLYVIASDKSGILPEEEEQLTEALNLLWRYDYYDR